MSNDKMREEFEAAIAEEAGQSLAAIQLSRMADSYSTSALIYAWWAWKASKPKWQPMETCPKHVDVLFFNEHNGVIPGRLTDADSFMSDRERDELEASDEERYGIDAFGFGHWGVDRMDGSESPTQWMPYPQGPEVKP